MGFGYRTGISNVGFGGLGLQVYTRLVREIREINSLSNMRESEVLFSIMVHEALSPAVRCSSAQRLAFLQTRAKTSQATEMNFRCHHAISTTRYNNSPSSLLTPPLHQYLFLVGSGLGLLVALRSSLPLCLNHFFVPNSSSLSNSALGSLRWMKLQNPPRTQPSPLLSRQQASRKSVTGESSQ